MTEWKDISTANLDGTEVQLWSAEGWTPKAKWGNRDSCDGWYEEYWDADWRCYSKSPVYNPTHWMPLPTPPEAS